MHYKNGREAKAGDRIIHLPTGQGGVLHSANAGSTTCNGRLAITTPNDPYITLSECLHADDIARATIPDSSNTVTNEDWNRQKKSGAVATVAVLLLSMLLGAGCKTGPDGKRSIDVIKLSQAKAMIEPAAAGALRRVLQNSPEHAPLIARYAASVAGVFCTMSLSNQFSPDFLIAEADKFFDPALEKIGDGYVLDAKNAGVGIYRLLWGDRLRAEIPEDQWLHQVCEFFCESINQGLTDAGYPGGVRKSAEWGVRSAEFKFGRGSESPLGSLTPGIGAMIPPVRNQYSVISRWEVIGNQYSVISRWEVIGNQYAVISTDLLTPPLIASQLITDPLITSPTSPYVVLARD